MLKIRQGLVKIFLVKISCEIYIYFGQGNIHSGGPDVVLLNDILWIFGKELFALINITGQNNVYHLRGYCRYRNSQ